MKSSLLNAARETFQHSQAVAFALLIASILGIGSIRPAAAAPITWHGNNGTNPTFWDIGTTPNWNGSVTNYAEGDAVTFNNTAVGYTVSIQPAAVNPVSMSISGGTAYSFSGGSISGATSIAHSGTAMATFSNNSLAFAGGTVLSNTGDITYSPTTAGAKSFGSAPIQLNNAGALFIYTPTTAGSTLTNDFVINAAVIWDKQSASNGTRTGTVTVNNNFSLRNDGTFPGIMDANMVLTNNRTISGGLYFNFPRIAGNVTSSGGVHDITLQHVGQNPDWQYYVGNGVSTPAWNVKNFTRSSGASVASRSGTMNFDVDEQTFFSNVEANGGQLYVEGDTRFLRSTTVEIGYNMIVRENNSTDNGGVNPIGTGFRFNSKFDINNGGLLGGNATIARRDDLSATTGALAHQLPVDVEAFAGGQVSPGDATAVDTTDILRIRGNMVFNGGQLTIDVTGGGQTAGADFDQLIVMDSATPSARGNVSGLSSATLVVDFHNVPSSLLLGDTLTIVTSLNNLTGQQFGSVTALNTTDFWFSVVYGNGVIQLTNFVSTIPEPSTASLLGLGLVGFGIRRRRKQAAA